jgi:putative spermidine/putrescine transport system ATP-binding protein
MSTLTLAALSKSYGPTLAVADVTLEVGAGEALALLGPSGCGKTTTLRMVAGLVPPTAGRIALGGEDITGLPPHRRNMGYVFQSYALFPHMSVQANVAFGLVERGVAKAERDARVAEALAMVRLQGLEARKPRELSGGQQQRVALARALVVRPAVLLLDESLSNLDAKLRDAMRHEIREIQRSLAITTLFVTHDQVEALTMCDRIAVMEAGRVVQVGTPQDIYERPATRFVAGFVGRAAVLPAEPGGQGVTVGGVPLPLRPPGPGAHDLYLRPQRVRLTGLGEFVGPDHARLPGRVARAAFVGERVEVLVDTAAGRLTVELPSGGTAPAEGAEVAVVFALKDAMLFPRAG